MRYPVVFPTPDPFSTAGLPDKLKVRTTLVFLSGRHGVLMRILSALTHESQNDHLLDLAMQGAVLRYRLMGSPETDLRNMQPENGSLHSQQSSASNGVSVDSIVDSNGGVKPGGISPSKLQALIRSRSKPDGPART